MNKVLLLLLLLLLWQYKRLDGIGWAANRNQPQHRLKFVLTITQ